MSLSAPIPTIRLSHCPYLRISNVKPAHAERYICSHSALYSLYDIYAKMHTNVSGIHLIIYKGGNRMET